MAVIMWSQTSATRSSGNTSFMERAPDNTLKASVSCESQQNPL